jgi:hypothetical protein
MSKQKWKVGDRVQWDGAAYYTRTPRYYRGTILEINGGLAYVKDDEWGARSAVRLDKLEQETSKS